MFVCPTQKNTPYLYLILPNLCNFLQVHIAVAINPNLA